MKVLIIHFRSAPASGWKQLNTTSEQKKTDSAGTDGVSLEIKKRRLLLEEMGHTVAICSAYEWAEYPLSGLEFDSIETRKMMRNLFENIEDSSTEEELKHDFNNVLAVLEYRLNQIIDDFSPEIIFVHNILCLPIHPAATIALTNLLKKTEIPCTAIHHDILSEGAYKFKPTCDFAETILKNYFPPTMHNLIHWTINSRNQNSLKNKNIQAHIIHDTMNFDEKLDDTEYNRLRGELRLKFNIKSNDIVLFMGARIVPNKQIEIAGELTRKLQSLGTTLMNQKLYNNEIFTEQSQIFLVLAGRPEAAFIDYQQKLFNYFNSLNIAWKYVGDIVRPLKSEKEGFFGLYPDMYTMADFVLYPTGWEGFGNQLLEAFAAGLPVSLFEYPVFKEDIAPKGVSVVSLGDTMTKSKDGLVKIPEKNINAAAQEILSILRHPEKYNKIVAHNISIGKQYFSFDVLRSHLNYSIEWARQNH